MGFNKEEIGMDIVKVSGAHGPDPSEKAQFLSGQFILGEFCLEALE